MKFLSQRGYAEHRRKRGLSGGTPRAVQKALATGRITAHPDGRIDGRLADSQWKANTSVTKMRQPRRLKAVPPSEPGLTGDLALADILARGGLAESSPTAEEIATAGRKELIDQVVMRSLAIPDLLLKLGLRDPIALLAAREVFVGLVVEFAGSMADDAYNWDDQDIPNVQPDFQALAKTYSLDLKPEHQEAADQLVSQLYQSLDEIQQPEPQAAAGGTAHEATE